MSPHRRTFFQTVFGGSATDGGAPFTWADDAISQAPRPLRILILGGTRYIGPHQVTYALARGHTVTLFNRGRTNPELFPEVEKLRGDRNDDLESLKGREWDAVIDNSATIPRWVRQTAQLLKHSVGQYLFVSSTGVYFPYPIVDIDETADVATIDDPQTEQVRGSRGYGALKALSEGEAQRAFPETALIVRPQYIVGPGDNTDRFTYWPVRIDRGGEVLAPGEPSDPIQYVDVRDLTQWMIRMVEESRAGVYNAAGPAAPLSNAEFLYGLRAVTNASVAFTWVDADFLEARRVPGIVPWVAPRGEALGMARIDATRAKADGLTFRPLAETARDTLIWYKSLPAERQRQTLPEQFTRYDDILAEWHNENPNPTSH